MKNKVSVPIWSMSLSMVLLLTALFTPLHTIIFGLAGLIGTLVSWFILAFRTKDKEDYIDVTFTESDQPSSDFDERLRKLENLRTESLISEDEYEKKRRDILKEKW